MRAIKSESEFFLQLQEFNPALNAEADVLQWDEFNDVFIDVEIQAENISDYRCFQAFSNMHLHVFI
jgi:hypothetical protein